MIQTLGKVFSIICLIKTIRLVKYPSIKPILVILIIMRPHILRIDIENTCIKISYHVLLDIVFTLEIVVMKWNYYKNIDIEMEIFAIQRQQRLNRFYIINISNEAVRYFLPILIQNWINISTLIWEIYFMPKLSIWLR